MELNASEAVLRIFLAVLLGSIIGLEREFTQQSAGLRTHILVCLGSTIYTILSVIDLTQGTTASVSANHIVGYKVSQDPSRIAANIVTGIGFIGGGAVLRHGASVRGLTTAASLWMVASIGMLVGTGHYRLSLVTTIVTFLVLFTIGNIERSMLKKHLKTYNHMRILVTVRSLNVPEIQAWIEKGFSKDIVELKSVATPESETTTLTYTLNVKTRSINVNELSRKMNNLTGVMSTGIKLYQEE